MGIPHHSCSDSGHVAHCCCATDPACPTTFVASNIKDLFDNIEAHKIIDFIKETRFHKQL